MIELALRCPNWTGSDDPQPHSAFVLEADPFHYAKLSHVAELLGQCERCGTLVGQFLFVDPATLEDDAKTDVDLPSAFSDAFRGKAGA